MNGTEGFFWKWIKAVARYFGIIVSMVFLIVLGIVIFQYITCPIYRFPDPAPFTGRKIFNPYAGLDSNFWRKANFQVQSYAWGGLTDGRKNTNEVIDSVYRYLSYDIIATSDYQRINRWGIEKESFIPVYEHGYGFFKNHQVLLGSKKVNWADFPVFQNIHHKQHILNLLRNNNELVYIAHPGLRGGYKPEDMKYLTGYDGLEVLNYVIVSEAHWDSALSAGKYVTIMGNDDSHDVRQPLEVGHRCTYIYSPSLHGDSIIAALKQGRAYGADIFRTGDETMEEKAAKAKKIATLESVCVSNDTLWVSVDKEAKLFRFIGQGGAVMKRAKGGNTAFYAIQPEDTYIRSEILFPNRDVFYLNPVIRYNGEFPSNPPQAEVDPVRSWIFWIVSWATLLVVLVNIYYLPRRWRRRNWSFKQFLNQNKYRKYLLALILISLVIKGVLAIMLELGNDEVYYWTYALFPDLSHFDHPPMVGWVIQFFSLDLLFQDEFFLRLPGLVFGVFNLLLVYRIGKTFRDAHTGWLAALLYTASIYAFIISGTLIMPDTPQLFFWLLAMYLFARSVAGDPANKGTRWLMILAGFAVGLAMLSKYTSVYLWIGSGLFIILYNRKWLRSVYLYISILLSLLVFLPVIVWNVQNDFISFTFHGGRAGFFQGGLQPQFFLTELTGEVLYNNPLVFLIIILALIAVIRGKSLFVTKGMERLILLWSLPLILTFLFLSLFRQTLPHWTGPAYTTLIFLAAAFLSGKQELGGRKRQLRWYPASALSLLLIIMVVGVLQVNYGFFYNGSEEEMTQRGKDDVSLDMYGWDQVMKEFRWLASEHESRGIMKENSPIVTHRWFPAAHLDYYVARHTNKVVLAYGSLKDIHKYGWINSIRGGFRDGMDAYYITTSRDYKDPEELFAGVFRKIELAYYFPIVRHGRNAAYGFVYHLKGFEGNKKDDIFFN